MTSDVVIDVDGGELRIGGLVLPIAEAHPDGAVRLCPPSGPVFRPITFGERLRRVERASASADPVESLCAAITACAMVSAGEAELSPVEREASQTLALVLAGADIEAPPFTDAMLLLGGGAGWRYDEIEKAEAARVDRLARRLEPQREQDDDGWSRVIFSAPAPQASGIIRRDLARRLLERFTEVQEQEVFGSAHAGMPEGTAAGPVKSGPAGWEPHHNAAGMSEPEAPHDEESSRIASDDPATGMKWSGKEAYRSEPYGTPDAGSGGHEYHGDPHGPRRGIAARWRQGDTRSVQRAAAERPVLMPEADENGNINPAHESSGERPRARVLGYTLQGWSRREECEKGNAGDGPVQAGRASARWGNSVAVPAGEGVGNGSSAANGETEREGAATASRRDNPGWNARPRESGTAVMPWGPVATTPRSRQGGAEAPALKESSSVDTGITGGTSGGVPAALEPSPQWTLFPTAPAGPEPGRLAPLVQAGESLARRPEEQGIAAVVMELADALADLLNEEADLRGIDR